MHNWTTVYLPYCDGTSFSGDAVTNGLHFKGAAILEAVLDDLQSTTAIGEAPTVVVSGGSAGASTVYYHIDHIADVLGSSSTEVIGMPDAGFFLNLPSATDPSEYCWPDQMRSLWALSNGYGSLDADCLARYPDASEQWHCLFPGAWIVVVSNPSLPMRGFVTPHPLTTRIDRSHSPTPCRVLRGHNRHAFFHHQLAVRFV